ncbi:AIR synthase-related protein [Erysipelothrix aquatica]|uniref:AIR synthase-related protein n=1 Tax=Erysipelothrix aquatica TaxID=2683714 RepID=UPI00135AAE73|nr:AIR synthase-related protein [Erysipelothrix aquatica]
MGQLIVTSRSGLDATESNFLTNEAKTFLNLNSLVEIQIFHIFEFDNVTPEHMDIIKERVFDEGTNIIRTSLPALPDTHIHVRYVQGQYDALQDEVAYMVNKMMGMSLAKVSHSIICSLEGVNTEDFETFKKYYINPVELEVYGGEKSTQNVDTSDLDPIKGFITMNEEEILEFSKDFAMDFEDMKFTQAYFMKEGRNPNRTEIKVIDTYWSDHCRHTTFFTILDSVSIEGQYKDLITETWESYLETRELTQSTHNPISLMNIATINAKEIRQKGLLEDLDESEEVNAASIHVDIDGEDTLLLFKNETHNHPTEIEPYGGASTCIGGGVRDPLSGRGYVYQAMRITGAKKPTLPYANTRLSKLSQRQLCQKATEGYTDYLNQMGIEGGYVKEYYHDGFEAKRLELGALVASVPSDFVQKSIPSHGDRILFLGARTGRDGLGAAVGSSKTVKKEAMESVGAEVQKGNPFIERKIVRLFRNPQAIKRIKRCNDMGAGGISVAVGEIADSLKINLDAVPLKYEGLNGGEIALSESQERMVVIVNQNDVEEFKKYAKFEDCDCVEIAEVTDSGFMEMIHKGKTVIKLNREFLSSNGTAKHAEVRIESKKVVSNMESINLASQRGLTEQFNQQGLRSAELTPSEGMAAPIPVSTGLSNIASIMTHGYNPFISETSPFHAGYIATIDAITKVVAMGGSIDKIRLSYQEYFESLGKDPVRWGKPLAALLGAFKVMKALNIPALGGKDSMSGSFDNIDVPPSLLCFAVQTTPVNKLNNRVLKDVTSKIVLVNSGYTHDTLIDMDHYARSMNTIKALNDEGKILAASSITRTIEHEIFEMSVENRLLVSYDTKPQEGIMPGSLLVQVENPKILEELDYTVIASVASGKVDESLEQKISAWEEPLKEIYRNTEWNSVAVKQELHPKTMSKHVQKCKMIIPVLSGVTGDIHLELNLKSLNIEHEFVVINHENYEVSIQEFTDKLNESNTLFLADGYKMVNNVLNSGTYYQVFLTHPLVKNAISRLIRRQGIVLGSGAGFVGLVNTGYFQGNTKITASKYHKFISKALTACVVNNRNRLFQGMLGQDIAVRLNGFYINVETDSTESCFLVSEETLGETPMVLGLQSKDGHVIGTITQIENNEVLLSTLLNYFA